VEVLNKSMRKIHAARMVTTLLKWGIAAPTISASILRSAGQIRNWRGSANGVPRPDSFEALKKFYDAVKASRAARRLPVLPSGRTRGDRRRIGGIRL
jgi:hypothetical protein